jgi:hypothetical protein
VRRRWSRRHDQLAVDDLTNDVIRQLEDIVVGGALLGHP